jgi:hypothetical protein
MPNFVVIMKMSSFQKIVVNRPYRTHVHAGKKKEIRMMWVAPSIELFTMGCKGAKKKPPTASIIWLKLPCKNISLFGATIYVM